MTSPNPQEVNLILILGEMRGDLKNIAASLATMDHRISSMDEETTKRMERLEVRLNARLEGQATRIAILETIKTRIGTIAVTAGILAGAFAPKLSALFYFALGG